MRIYLAAAMLLGLYLLPWVVNPSASLTPNGYDLAEWSSLNPAVLSQTPPLLTSLLLRLPLACVGLVIVFSTRRSLLAVLVVLITIAALLPPLEFIRSTGDPNYRQQAAIALVTLILGSLGVTRSLARYRVWMAVGIALIGALAALVGLAQAYDLMHSFGLPTQIGAGGVGMILTFLAIAGIQASAAVKERRITPLHPVRSA